jgi:hypothetical protein
VDATLEADTREVLERERERAWGDVSDLQRSIDGVVDIDAGRRHLESLGVKLDETFDVHGMVHLMGFYDPDGNPWMLAETSETYPGK